MSIRDRLARKRYDAIVIGAGANGLAAAITCAKAGWSVALIEAADAVGGACRSLPLTLPGFVHDVGSAIHPLAAGSPFFRTLSLEAHGLEWVQPDAPVVHPLDGGRFAEAAVLERSVAATAAGLGGGAADGAAYRKLIAPLLANHQAGAEVLSDLFSLSNVPSLEDIRHFPLFGLMRLGGMSARSARSAADSLFAGSRARALFAGICAHSFLPLERSPSAGIGLALTVAAHAFGWPFPRGGAQKLSDGLASLFQSLGGEILLDAPVTTLDDLPPASVILCDLTPSQLLKIAGEQLPFNYKTALSRFELGVAAFKVDWALDGPIPFREEIAEACGRTATVHLGGTFAEIAESERATVRGDHPERPYVLLAQHTLFDPSRAPAGKHTVWAYCHVPNGSTVDMTDRIEAQIERFAPGFRERILARHVFSPKSLETFDANLVGGDISGGKIDWRQLLARPTAQPIPYATPVPGLYLCSSSTPPGPGVHGLCGYYAARLALFRLSRTNAQ